jgi:hypothetical protein
MGHEIVYCVRCATRVVGADFERGKAFRAGGKVVCATCLAEILPTLSPEEQKEISLSSTKMRAVKQQAPSHATSSRTAPVRIAAPPPPPKSRTGVIVAVSLGAIALLAAVGVMASRSTPSPADLPASVPIPPKTADRTSAPPPPPGEKREEAQWRDAREAIDAARAKLKSAPEDLDAQVAAWEEAARKAALTPLFKEASAALQEVRDRKMAAKPPLPREPEKPALNESTPKPPAADSKAFLDRWEPAMAKASARDFEGAIADLGRAAAELSDDAARRDARADAEDLQRVRILLAEVPALLAKLSRGQSVALGYRSETGERKRTEGAVVRSGPARVEIRQGEASVFVEAEDVTAGTWAALLGTRGEAERRTLGLLSILEGDREAAERLAGSEAFPARTWDYARAAAAKVPKPSPRELEARNRFYAAEREFPKMDTLAAAVGKYKSLAEDYADTRVVKGELPRIQKRSEAGRDYVLVAGALKGVGTFALAPAPRTELAWASKTDVEGNQGAENFVEAEFAALPETAYRCWALVGGCCGETFTFYLQTTEGTDLHPKTRQKTSIDPGAALASLVKHAIPSLKKTHEEHKIKGSKTHPKTAARWEWVSIPLPKYSGPGPKKIRLISDQQGFAVGAIAVSSTRSVPPADPELKEEAARVVTAAAEEGRSIGEPLVTGKPWRPLFDGTTIACLRGVPGGWRVETGALAYISGSDDAAQTREEIGDGELRIRFEVKDLERLWFTFRQGADGGYGVAFEGALKSLEGKPHDLIFVAKGDQVTATLDGKPISVMTSGASKSGVLQFNARGKMARILSLDAR